MLFYWKKFELEELKGSPHDLPLSRTRASSTQPLREKEVTIDPQESLEGRPYLLYDEVGSISYL